MQAQLTEDYMVEQAAVNWLKDVGYSYIHGSKLAPENGERESMRCAVLKTRLIRAIKRINPWLTDDLAERVYKKVTDIDHPDFLMKSRIFYDMLVNGVKIKTRKRGREKVYRVKLVDFEDLDNNEFLTANQFEVEFQFQKEIYRRPDLIVFINGFPLVIFEFKGFNAGGTAKDAFYDHQAKIENIPQLYVYAQILGVSDGLETKYGSISSDWERFFTWEGIFSDDDLKARKIGEKHYSYTFRETGEKMTSLEVLIKGLLRKNHLVEYIKDFVIYEKSGETQIKKIAMFQQFYAVKKAVERTVKAVVEGEKPEERRIGVIWHTQGSGKSLTMLYYARKLVKVRELENPMLLFITDRRDLDEQLYKEVFSPVLPIVRQAKSIPDLQNILRTEAGGIIFTTIQKFGKKKEEEYPFLTDRKNIIVIADEAHRSQYRELAMNLRKAIPNASFIGFTATPIQLQDRSTTLVFGDYISIYPMSVARRHKVVVPIYYEARLPELHLTNEFIDEEFEELAESMDDATKRALFRRLEEKILKSEERMERIAKDIVIHFNERTTELEGKAMVVVISRTVAVKLYEKIIKQRGAPSLAVVMSGSKARDPKDFWPHIRERKELEELKNNFKNPEKDPQMVIVVDMWLTGFDIPCLHTMYFDKPMKNHSLVQAIARVNRVFKDKPGGLIIDYIGIADDLRKSLAIYTLNTIREIFLDIEEVINQLKEKYDVVSSFFHGINYKDWDKQPPEKLSLLTTMAYDRVCRDNETKKRFVKNYIALKKLYALASPHPEAISIKNDIRFFEMIKKMVIKYSPSRVGGINRDLEYEIGRLISKSIAAEKPVDLFTLMGKEKPDISIFDERFLEEFKNMKQKNYAAEVLAKIIKDQIVAKMKINPFRYGSLYEKLKKIIEKYNLKRISTVEIIELLITLAHEFKRKMETGKELDLSEKELAFYDLLSSKEKFFENQEEIRTVAKEIIKELGGYVKVADWNRKEYLKAKIKAAVKRILIKVIDGRAKYDEIKQLSTEIVNHAETIYALHYQDNLAAALEIPTQSFFR